MGKDRYRKARRLNALRASGMFQKHRPGQKARVLFRAIQRGVLKTIAGQWPRDRDQTVGGILARGGW